MSALVLSELFASIAELREVVPSLGMSVDMIKLNSSAFSAKRQICNIITTGIYESIITGNNQDLRNALAQAMANATMAKQVSFDAVEYRKAGTDVFKSEQEHMRRGFIENYYNAMDMLLALLVDEDAWKTTSFYKTFSDLKITTADEFTNLYPIDGSNLFFFRTMPIQAEIIDEDMGDYFELATSKEDTKSETRLKRALAQLVVSVAIRRLDPMELPSAIRNLFDDGNVSRSGDLEQSRLLNLSNELFVKATEAIKQVDMILNSEDTTENVDVETSFNEITDKIYLLP